MAKNWLIPMSCIYLQMPSPISLFRLFSSTLPDSTTRCSHGRPQGGAKRAFSPLEIATKKQKLLENLKLAA